MSRRAAGGQDRAGRGRLKVAGVCVRAVDARVSGQDRASRGRLRVAGVYVCCGSMRGSVDRTGPVAGG